MRTTIDLPDDLHALAKGLAQQHRTTLSRVVADLMRRALNIVPSGEPAGTIVPDPVTGFPTMSLGSRRITTEAVRQMQDDD